MAETKTINAAFGNKGLVLDYNKLKQTLGAKPTKELLSDLTLIKKKFAGPNRTLKLVSKIYQILDVGKGRKILILPRFYHEWSDVFEDHGVDLRIKLRPEKEMKRIPPERFQDEEGNETISLFDYQQVIHDHFIDEIFQPEATDAWSRLNAGGVLVLDTGRGKTYTAGGMIRTLGVKTLIIAHNGGGLEEWEKMLKCFPKLRVGYYSSKKKVDGDVVIMVINSAMRDNFKFGRAAKVISKDKYFKQFGMVIFDEVPCYLSEKRRRLFWGTNFRYVLGLTATPDENLNDWDPIYQMHLGPLVRAEELPGFNVDDVKWDYTVRRIHYYGPPEYTKALKSDKTGMTVSAWMDAQAIKDPYRNRMILNIIKEWYDEGEYIFIFGGKRSVIFDFRDMIIKELGLPAYAPEDKNGENPQLPQLVRDVLGGTSKEDKKAAADDSRIILTTYQYGTMSISIGKMTRSIGLTPRKHGMKQVTGRLTRADGDVSIRREHVDIIDENTTRRNQASTRLSDYNEKGFDVTDEDANWEDFDD